MKSFFVFDCESVGLHGETFAVGGGVYLENSAVQWEFSMACDPLNCVGNDIGLKWVADNCPIVEITHRNPKAVREAFWAIWHQAKADGAIMAADCAWPVESRFLIQCVNDKPKEREWQGPYPLMEIASYLAAAGMDPMKEYDRLPSELPKHNPLCDARQSARMLSIAMAKLEGIL